MTGSLHQFLGRKKGALAKSSSSYSGSDGVEVSEIWISKLPTDTRLTILQDDNVRRIVYRTILKSEITA